MAKEVTDELVREMAKRFRVLGDVGRLQLLHHLADNGEKSVGEMVTTMRRNQATVSKQLKSLAASGFLARRKVGLQVFYQLSDPTWERVCRLVRNAIRAP